MVYVTGARRFAAGFKKVPATNGNFDFTPKILRHGLRHGLCHGLRHGLENLTTINSARVYVTTAFLTTTINSARAYFT